MLAHLFPFVTMATLHTILISMKVSNFNKFNLVPAHNSIPGNYIYFC